MTFTENTALFLEEAQELIARMETCLLDLERHPEDRELVNEVFRALHTIKGSGAMFGFTQVSEFTHQVENLYDEVRKGKKAISPLIIDIGLRAADAINRLLRDPAPDPTDQVILSQISGLTEEKPAGAAPAPVAVPKVTVPVPESPMRTWRIELVPNPDILNRGVKIEVLLGELADLGQVRTAVDVDRLPPLEELDPTSVYFSWSVDLSTAASEAQIREVFLFVEDYMTLKIAAAGPEPRPKAPAEADNPVPVPSEPKGPKPPAERAAHQEVATIRVQKDKLDGLVDLVGELVILQAILELEAKKENRGSLTAISENLARLTADLRDTTMSIRMVPLEELFSSFQRLVRDLSQQVGKELRLEYSGGSTELDKNVIEALKDPIVHLIRNAADHGIEAKEARAQAGKDPVGSIHLGARQIGSRVLITVSDDGAGLNVDKIKTRAVERKLLDASENDPQRIWSMIFQAGFSTAEKTTNLSGRGVGMDVVKRNIEKLRGEVEIESEWGTGTEITLSIPLTLVIIEGLVVRVDKNDYVLSLAQVQECVDLTDEIRFGPGNDSMINLRGKSIPVLSIRECLGIGGRFNGVARLVIVNGEGVKVALMVDAVVGRKQVVIKPLSSTLRKMKILSGATIMGDGSVALILDVPEILKLKLAD
jgi:two-component system chemotaxis sensor kinase CheA